MLGGVGSRSTTLTVPTGVPLNLQMAVQDSWGGGGGPPVKWTLILGPGVKLENGRSV